MPKLQYIVIILLNLILVNGHDLTQKINTENECYSNKVFRNYESKALRMLSPVLDFVQTLKDRIIDKVNIDHIQHSKHYQKENHKYDHNNFYCIYGNPNEVNGITIVNVTGVKNGDVKHGKVMKWNRFNPDIMNHPGEYKILDHNGQEAGDVKVEYTVNGKPLDPNIGDLGFFEDVKLGLDDDSGTDINSKEENTEDLKYKTMPWIWPGGNIENKYKYPQLPTHYYAEELKKRKKERLAKKRSKKIYNSENIVTVHDGNGSYTISKHLQHSGDWSNGNNEMNTVKIVNVTGVKNGDIKHGKVLEWNGVGPLIINDPADTNNEGKRGYSQTKYTNRYVHNGYSSFGNKRWRRQNNGRR